MDDFNLVHDRWIPVLLNNGSASRISLSELFRDARSIRSLAGDSPSEDVAILRLCVAILFRATDTERSAMEQITAWSTWWSDWDQVVTMVGAYLDRYADRFNLFDPEKPLMQVASLTTDSGATSGMEKLSPGLGGWFSEEQGPTAYRASPARAAGLVIYTQAFDPAGIKTGASGDDRVKAGKGYSSGFPAWAGNLGIITLEGNCLAETLLLNLPLSLETSTDSAVWERPPQGAAVDPAHPLPTGPADLLTWQSRRLRLFRDRASGDVVDVQVSNGDFIRPENLHTMEPMAAFKLSENLTKKEKRDIYWPVQFSPGRQVWRGLESVLALGQGGANNLAWLAELQKAELLPHGVKVQLRTIAVVYGPQNSSFSTTIDDRIDADLIALVDAHLQQVAIEAIATARACIGALTRLAARLAEAMNRPENPLRDAAAARGYGALDVHYRQWFPTLVDPEAEIEHQAYSTNWQVRARKAVRQVGRALCQEAGTPAAVGRLRDGVRVDTAFAWNEFIRLLARATPSASPPSDQAEEPSHA